MWAWAVDMHMDISQQPFFAEIYGELDDTTSNEHRVVTLTVGQLFSVATLFGESYGVALVLVAGFPMAAKKKMDGNWWSKHLSVFTVAFSPHLGMSCHQVPMSLQRLYHWLCRHVPLRLNARGARIKDRMLAVEVLSAGAAAQFVQGLLQRLVNG